MLNILLIEPHGDDGICSASSILRSKPDKVKLDILTLSERSSKGLEELYSNINNITYLDLSDLNYSLRPKVSTHDIHRRNINGEDVYLYYDELLKDSCSDYVDSMKSIFNAVSNYLYNNFSNNDIKYDIILSPVGLCHPYHIVTRKGVESAIINYSNFYSHYPILIYYVDKPYYQYRYVKEMYESFRLYQGDFNEINSPEVNKEDSVLNTFKKVYPTELGMMRFSKDILTKSNDIYLVQDHYSDTLISKFKEVLS